MIRTLSHSEVASLLDCQLRHDFAYVGNVVGSALKPRRTHVNLRAGRAWGAAVAAWDMSGGQIEPARAALDASLEQDAIDMREAGWFNDVEFEELYRDLHAMLAHYTSTVPVIGVHTVEHELRVPIPSRSGKRASSLYQFHGFLDGVATDRNGRDWIVEYKLRKQLSSLEQITLGRQLRWYAWGWRETTGRNVAGIILDERLNAVPADVRFNKNGTVSRVQSCPVDDYVNACLDTEQEPEQDIVDQLRGKRWSQRHTIFLSDRDLDEAGWQMRSSARLVRELESGRMYPTRNPNVMRCGGCAFKGICVDRSDDLIDADFLRVPAKADRVREDVAA